MSNYRQVGELYFNWQGHASAKFNINTAATVKFTHVKLLSVGYCNTTPWTPSAWVGNVTGLAVLCNELCPARPAFVNGVFAPILGNTTTSGTGNGYAENFPVIETFHPLAVSDEPISVPNMITLTVAEASGIPIGTITNNVIQASDFFTVRIGLYR